MSLANLHSARGARSRRRRIGRGNASGTGTTAGKGTKGQKARSGGIKSSYRGMSSRMQRYGKLPGFRNRFRTEYAVVKLSDLNRFDPNMLVDSTALRDRGLVRAKGEVRIKLLANGEISKPLVVRLDKVTRATRAKLEAAGGRVEEMADASSSA